MNEKLVGKTIVKAEVDGYGVYLVFNDGTSFEYGASDGGCSCYDFINENGEVVE